LPICTGVDVVREEPSTAHRGHEFVVAVQLLGELALVGEPGRVGHAAERHQIVTADDHDVLDTRVGGEDRVECGGDRRRHVAGHERIATVVPGLPLGVGGLDGRGPVDGDDQCPHAERRIGSGLGDEAVEAGHHAGRLARVLAEEPLAVDHEDRVDSGVRTGGRQRAAL
jgi:hypothetical protein